MSKMSERITKLETARSASRGTRRIVRQVIDCAQADRSERLANIQASDPAAFHIFRIIVSPSETKAAA